ncbi:hypothetical protein KD050_08665 [Psychrobacillus sp. INOP01]|uniref:hypothetical protein n=1 Tax=Psychrobacillus sp. INOP01 TaxID=2829187 RepID=UPI001BAE4525|nr:hypothetical protein [Psychrobacillus sp. INOP01]QUG43273.1 hypothetical protein KD050_08665 [Psychrobacillus sp. INOP01]
MKKASIFPKVATDLFWVQLFWAFGFLGIMFAIHIVKIVLAINSDNDMELYFVSTFVASNIFMLVVGIISSYGFLPHYVSNGVTRKDYFKGAALASVGLSITLPVITSIVSGIELFVLKIFNMSTVFTTTFGERVNMEDDGIVTDIIQSIIIAPYVDPQSNWLLAIFIVTLNLLTFYLLGWLIGSAFYRFGVIIGIVFIAISIVLILIENALLSIGLGLTVSESFSSYDFGLPISILGVVVIIIIVLWVIRQITKRVAIKM